MTETKRTRIRRLSNRQKKVLERTLAFTPQHFVPSQEAIQAFFAYTDRGVRLPPDQKPEGTDQLMQGWKGQILKKKKRELHHEEESVREEPMSPSHEQWLDGHFSGDYPLAAVAMDFVRDAYEPLYGGKGKETWLRKLPAYQHLCQIRCKVGSGQHKKLLNLEKAG